MDEEQHRQQPQGSGALREQLAETPQGLGQIDEAIKWYKEALETVRDHPSCLPAVSQLTANMFRFQSTLVMTTRKSPPLPAPETAMTSPAGRARALEPRLSLSD
eukprot:763658-Hanusia_phi.AAC.7